MMNEQTQERDDGEPIDDSTRAGGPRHAVDMKDLPDLQEDRSDSRNPRSEFTTVYDIIDQIQAMLDEAKAPIFSPGLVKVDRDELADDLNELKKMLPVQLERASALMREAERRLSTSQTQANATISDAQSRAADIVKEAGEQARFLAGQENVVAIARQKAQTIIDTAQAQADRLVQGANGYADQVMGELDTQLNKMSQDVRAGLEVLHQREQEAARSMNASASDEGKETRE